MNYTQEQKAAFDRALAVIKDGMHPASYQTWFGGVSLHSVAESKILLAVKDSFALQHLKNRYATVLYSVIGNTFGKAYQVELYLEEELARRVETPQAANNMLNPRFTFDNFVVGPSNSLAHATALAVAETPGQAYNPLLIYGGVGLGKTHLMNAIGNYVQETNPDMKVVFITSEEFTNELIDCILKKKGTHELRERMRSADVFIVDDVQFLSKSAATQEEFFHTFNELHQHGKQVIMSSDRHPRDIPTIEDRLRTRFEWGLLVDIQQPDFETRVAILRRKADNENIDVPHDVVEYIASHATSNVREMEGMLNRLSAQANLMKQEITLEFAQSALSTMISTRDSRVITPKLIIQTVSGQYGITEDDIMSQKRAREIALPRQIAMYITRELTQLSTINIGREFGGRDHTTVMHGCDKISGRMKADISFRRRIDELIDMVKRA